MARAELERGGDRTATTPKPFSPEFVASEEFTVAFVSLLALFGLAVPLFSVCYHHVSVGHVDVGCAFGVVGTIVAGVSFWKLSTSVQCAGSAVSW